MFRFKNYLFIYLS